MMKFKHFLFAGAMLTLAASCGNSDDPTPNPTPHPGVTTFKGICSLRRSPTPRVTQAAVTCRLCLR